MWLICLVCSNGFLMFRTGQYKTFGNAIRGKPGKRMVGLFVIHVFSLLLQSLSSFGFTSHWYLQYSHKIYHVSDLCSMYLLKKIYDT